MAPAIDHYAILGLAFGASPEEIKKAHKKMALMYHPDKVQAKGGDPEVASAKFREIQESYQVLTDEKAKSAYDALQEAKRAQNLKREVKLEEMDKKRKLGVDLLEAREKAAKRRSEDLSGLEARYQSEVNRMHEQNKKVLEEMEARRREENEKKANSLFFAAENRANELQREAETIREKTRTLTLKWAKKGALDEPALRAAFEPFGEIDRLVVGKKSGIIIFNGDAAAANAVHSVRASQLALVASAGLSVEWTGGDAPAATPAEQAASATDAAKPNGETAGDPAPLAGNVGAAAAFAALAGAKAGVGSPMPGVAGVAAAGSPMPSFSSWSPAQEGGGVAEGSILQHRDYESVTMMRMRQMSERQRLADELDAAETAEGK